MTLLRRLPIPVRRVLARLLDAATVFALLWMLAVLRVLWFLGDLADRYPRGPWGSAFVPALAYGALAFVYEVVFLVSNRGQTPAKDALHLRVVAADGRIGWAAASARAVLTTSVWLAVPLGAGTVAAAAVAGALAALGRPRGLHDRLAGSTVIGYDRTAEDPAAPPPPPFRQRRSTRSGDVGGRVTEHTDSPHDHRHDSEVVHANRE